MSIFTVRVDLVDGRLTVSGDLDRGTAHCLLDAVSTLEVAAFDEWLMDLSGLASCDDDGLLALCAACHRATEQHCRMKLGGIRPGLSARLASWGVFAA